MKWLPWREIRVTLLEAAVGVFVHGVHSYRHETTRRDAEQIAAASGYDLDRRAWRCIVG